MSIPLKWTTEWQEHEAECRAIQRKLFPLIGRKVLQMARVKPIPAPMKPVPIRVDKHLDTLAAGEIPGAVVERTRSKRRR